MTRFGRISSPPAAQLSPKIAAPPAVRPIDAGVVLSPRRYVKNRPNNPSARQMIPIATTGQKTSCRPPSKSFIVLMTSGSDAERDRPPVYRRTSPRTGRHGSQRDDEGVDPDILNDDAVQQPDRHRREHAGR